MSPHWTDPYRALDPCADAWASARKSKSYASWWRSCERGDWMLWAMARSPEITQGSEEHVRLCWIVCRIWWELAYPWWYEYGQEHQDERPQNAIAALERWCQDPSGDGAAGAAWAAVAAEAAVAAVAAWAAVAADAVVAAEAAGAAEAAEAAGAAWAAVAAEAAGAAWAAVAAEAAGAAWAAVAAEAAGAAALLRVAEIIREELPDPPARPVAKP